MTHTNTEALSDLLPCPFCGGEPRVSTYETESLWSHDQVTYTKVECPECDVAFNSEPGYDLEAPAAWNRRSASNTGGVEVKAAALAQAYLRGVEWRDENPGHVDYAYRFKAAGDYADKATSSPAAEAEPVAQGSCASCNGTGDTGGNPSYGMCPDCDGTGKFPPAHPSSSVSAEVTEALVWKGGEARSRAGDLYSVHKHSNNVWSAAWNGTPLTGWWLTEPEAKRAAQMHLDRAALNGGRKNG